MKKSEFRKSMTFVKRVPRESNSIEHYTFKIEPEQLLHMLKIPKSTDYEFINALTGEPISLKIGEIKSLCIKPEDVEDEYISDKYGKLSSLDVSDVDFNKTMSSAEVLKRVSEFPIGSPFRVLMSFKKGERPAVFREFEIQSFYEDWDQTADYTAISLKTEDEECAMTPEEIRKKIKLTGQYNIEMGIFVGFIGFWDGYRSLCTAEIVDVKYVDGIIYIITEKYI